MKQRILICFFFILFAAIIHVSLQGAYLRNVPVKVTQPNGQVLDIYASGDEFYNWLHDAAGRTIIRHPDTGYLVYAVEKDGKLLPSDSIVGSAILSSIETAQHVKFSVANRMSPSALYPGGSPANVGQIKQAPQTGTINNIVIFIRFSGESEFTDLISTYDDMFNDNTAGVNSMQNYYYEVSYSQLTITSHFYPTAPATTVVSYQDSQTRDYYKPYDATTNPTGYQNDTERRNREHTLLKNAVDGVSGGIPGGLNVDGDSDGYVDNVCFIVYGSPEGWNELLWPHMWSLYSQTAYINGKRVWTYNFQLQTSLNSSGVGVLCHEMFHSLGSPDLYHYSFDGLHPVYNWGLMEYTSNPPRHMGAYMKYRYGTWISSIPEITSSSTYSLNPLTSSTNNCYKIASPFSSSEYFVIEYRKKVGTFENSLPGEGILVYRINTDEDGYGNSGGPPDEVYIYRPNGSPTADGTPTTANFSSDVGRTSIDDTTNPSSFLSDGLLGGLELSNLGAVGGTISFDGTFPAAGTYLLAVQSHPDAGASIDVSLIDNSGYKNGSTNFIRNYNSGTNVTLKTPANLSGKEFTAWTVDGSVSSSRTVQVNMSDHRSAVAVYLPPPAWLATKRITWNSGSSEMPDITADTNDTLHAIWEDNTPGDRELYYAKSTNGGTNWTSKRFTWIPGESSKPVITTSSSNVYALWQQSVGGNFEIYFKKSTNGGTGWVSTKRLTWNSGDSENPDIVAEAGGIVHCVWHDDSPGNDEIYYKRSTNGGTSWTSKRLTWTGSISRNPRIAEDAADNIFVIWEEYKSGNYEIYLKKSTDGGTTWGEIKRLTWTSGDSFHPVFAIDSNDDVHFVWNDDTTGNMEIYYKKSTSHGATWSSTKRLTWNSGDSVNPELDFDSNDDIFLFWNDLTPGDDEIFTKRSRDGGTTWRTDRLTYNAGSSQYPRVTIDSTNRINIMWMDSTPANFEIYFKAAAGNSP